MIPMTAYNKEQIEVIEAPEPYVAVIAPPGSGKSASLIGSVLKYYNEHPNDNITAITFTRKAAGELKSRINHSDIEVSTIHSWSYRRLNLLGEQYGFKVQLLEEDTIKEILKKLCQLRRHYYLNQFQLYAYVMGNYNVDVDDNIKKIYRVIYNDYVKFKSKNRLYDFTDLPKYLLDMLKEYEQEIDNIDAFYVDEFQDIDPVQLELFDLIKAKKKFYIMDPDQAIYAFRGSVERVEAKLPDFKFYNLAVNYRSYQSIIDYATTVRDAANSYGFDEYCAFDFFEVDYSVPSERIVCDRGDGGFVYVIRDVSDAIQVNAPNELCNDTLIIKRLLADRETQVLCRSNRQVKKLQSLGITNVSTVHQAKGLEYKNVLLANFPITNEEELNICYVGMTRAKDVLCIIDFDTLTYTVCQEQITTSTKLF